MTLAALSGGGLWYPFIPYSHTLGSVGTLINLNAASTRCAQLGKIYIAGRATNKTLSTGKIWYRARTVTFASGSTTIDVGIQGVDQATGNPVRPNGTFSAKTTLTGGISTINANAWNSATITSGTVTLSHGDYVAVVHDMTARGGADTVGMGAGFIGNTVGQPAGEFACLSFSGGTWTNIARTMPEVVIEFDDGTLGVIDNPWSQTAIGLSSSEVYSDSTNPDERGLIFQVPWACKIDGLWFFINNTSGTCALNLYSDPLGTPSSLYAIANIDSHYMFAGNYMLVPMPEIALSANADYCLALKGTNASTFIFNTFALEKETYRVFMPGGTSLRKGSRNNGSGAFTAESPALTMYMCGVRISQVHDSSGGGGGSHIIGGSLAT